MASISRSTWLWLVPLLAWATLSLVLSCASGGRGSTRVQEWWSGRGPVVPHEKFPADCSLCHEGKGWTSIRADFRFDHEAETGVRLEGAHASAECLRCHNDRGPVAMFAARGCGGCHEDPHRSQLGPDCSTCHEQESWRPGELIATHARTRFPLVGAHAVAACWQCHPGAQSGNFARVDTSCEACHAQDLARALNPDHAAQGWTSDCQRCHIPIAWGGASFTHSAFPLTGAHVAALCADCHGMPPTYVGTPNQCFDCHAADYNGAASPDHVTFNFSTSCEQCHSTSTWQGANFNHVGISSGCGNCHMPDWQATTNPNHAAAGFGTTCEQCHTSTTNWLQDNWPHPDFPINSGRHTGLSCTECHQQPANYSSFSCTHCHEHRQSEMDDKHQNVSGYTWTSPACYQCHPNGQE